MKLGRFKSEEVQLLKKIVILDQELPVNVAICTLVWSWCQDITVTCSIIFEDCLRPEATDRLAAPCRFAGCMCGGCAKYAREVTPHVFHPACLTSALVAGSTPRTWCASRWQWGRTTAMYPTITGCTPSPWRTPCTPWSRPVSTSSRT